MAKVLYKTVKVSKSGIDSYIKTEVKEYTDLKPILNIIESLVFNFVDDEHKIYNSIEEINTRFKDIILEKVSVAIKDLDKDPSSYTKKDNCTDCWSIDQLNKILLYILSKVIQEDADEFF